MTEAQVLVGCAAQIYDAGDRLVYTSKVKEFDRRNAEIEVEGYVPGLKKGEVCRVYVASPPTPCEFKGKILMVGYGSTTFGLYNRQEKEVREHPRYPVKTPAVIERMVYAGQSYALHTPASVLVLNISKGGVKVRAPHNAMAVGNKFEMRLRIGEQDQMLLAEVMNANNIETTHTDYGCRLRADETPVRVE